MGALKQKMPDLEKVAEVLELGDNAKIVVLADDGNGNKVILITQEGQPAVLRVKGMKFDTLNFEAFPIEFLAKAYFRVLQGLLKMDITGEEFQLHHGGDMFVQFAKTMFKIVAEGNGNVDVKSLYINSTDANGAAYLTNFKKLFATALEEFSIGCMLQQAGSPRLFIDRIVTTGAAHVPSGDYDLIHKKYLETALASVGTASVGKVAVLLNKNGWVDAIKGTLPASHIAITSVDFIVTVPCQTDPFSGEIATNGVTILNYSQIDNSQAGCTSFKTWIDLPAGTRNITANGGVDNSDGACVAIIEYVIL